MALACLPLALPGIFPKESDLKRSNKQFFEESPKNSFGDVTREEEEEENHSQELALE